MIPSYNKMPTALTEDALKNAINEQKYNCGQKGWVLFVRGKGYCRRPGKKDDRFMTK